jgi:hypothetical protein
LLLCLDALVEFLRIEQIEIQHLPHGTKRFEQFRKHLCQVTAKPFQGILLFQGAPFFDPLTGRQELAVSGRAGLLAVEHVENELLRNERLGRTILAIQGRR